ncbi:hypothetical protein DAPPUDRAFT_335858, partial [Daphnia pulex]
QSPESTEELTVALQDEVLRIKSVQASGKVKAIDVHVSTKGELGLLALLRGNSFEIHVVDTKVSNKNDATKVGALSIPGHRTDVRALCFSLDKIALASASGESLKIWNRGSQNCIRTMACDYALSILFATGDHNVIVATKTGKLQIFDIAAGRLLEEIRAHEGEAWTVAMSPDLRGIASGGADKSVKFWQFEFVVDKAAATSQTRVLQFQGEFGRLRVEFMSACSQLVQACRTLQTAPPSAIADAVAAATRDELQRCGRITHQLRKSVLVLRQVAEACPSWDRAPSTPTRRASRICSYKSRRP